MYASESRLCPAPLRSFLQRVGLAPHDLIALLARIGVGGVFFQSGQTKLDGWQLAESTVYLFQTEYRLPLIDSALAAYLAAFCENVFSVLLILGLASRLSAGVLLAMAVVIQVFVYPGAWPTHATWAAALWVVIAGGPGRVALDAAIARVLKLSSRPAKPR
ncbi:DoxX family protein [Pseudomonas typographi]|uniref:DoxX family protein n=1 Tax=Pseudomonas typographi TaxID=2715964 RepID=A0ABR7Z2B1_9PSED|nr:DoxX family protein [Pseudomonas typographi]MBD1599629.1 DoxX family protein [Pseudomonas typographi]